MPSKHQWYARESPCEDERGKWFVFQGSPFVYRDTKGPIYFPRVIGASSDGSGADLTQNEAVKIVEALNA